MVALTRSRRPPAVSGQLHLLAYALLAGIEKAIAAEHPGLTPGEAAELVREWLSFVDDLVH